MGEDFVAVGHYWIVLAGEEDKARAANVPILQGEGGHLFKISGAAREENARKVSTVLQAYCEASVIFVYSREDQGL